MKHLNVRLRIVLVLLACVVCLPSFAFAQQKVSFQISPTMIEESIDPGSSHSYTITVRNLGDKTSKLYPLARNIVGLEAGGTPIFDEDQNYELASWISYAEKNIEVQPGTSQELHFTVQFPKDARPGSHMAGVYLSDVPVDEIRNGSAIGFQVGSVLSFRIAGEIIEKTEVREFYASKNVYATPDVGFTIRLENEGNVLTKPVGLIDVTNMFGKKVASIPVNESEARVFPKDTREFSAKWKSENLEFGRYEAVLALVIRGVNENRTISRVVQFWVLPMDVLTPILGSILAFLLVVYILLRLYIRRQLAGVRSNRSATKSTRGLSRLAVVVIALLIAIILGLFILFFYFG